MIPILKRILFYFAETTDIPEEDKQALITKLEDNPFIRLQEDFRTYYKINRFAVGDKTYIAPVQIKLAATTDRKASSFQYISVIDTVEAIITDPDFPSSTPAPEGLLRDVTDGSAFKENSYFQKNPDAIPIALYSDAFQLSNPLGASKGKQKVVNVYLTLLNMEKSHRSKTESMYLLLTVKESDLKRNRNAVYKPLIEDLKKLEKGVLLGGKVIRVGLFCCLGDNLEQHTVGGFSASFSSRDICRVCHQQYEDLTDISGVPRAPLWTASEYDDAVEDMEHDARGQYGLNGECLFNSLEAFHCVGQMPLDVMHDWLEKVGAYDALSIVKALIKAGYFTLDAYNAALRNVILGDYEVADRPPSVGNNADRLPGKALSVALEIRVLPVIILRLRPNLEEADINASPLLILLSYLHRLNEYMLADSLSITDTDRFQDLLVDYFAQRKVCEEMYGGFLKITPRYHYLGKWEKFFVESY